MRGLKKRALVTGATGFIGSHLVSGLVRREYEVHCLVRKTSGLGWLEGLDIKLHIGDCADLPSLRKAVKYMDYVFHLAGITKARDERDFYVVNARGTENILDAVATESPGLSKFIYISSLAAAGPSRNGLPVDEDTAEAPVSLYGKSKLEGERAVLRHVREKDLPAVIIRPPVVYGPRDRGLRVLFRMVKRGIFPYWGVSRYSLIYVDDLVRGIIQAAESPSSGGKIFFLADETPYTNTQIASVMAEVFSTKPLRVPVPRIIMQVVAGVSGLSGRESYIINRDKLREMWHRDWVCNTARVQSELGFVSRTKLKEGIRWTADWYRIHQWL